MKKFSKSLLILAILGLCAGGFYDNGGQKAVASGAKELGRPFLGNFYADSGQQAKNSDEAEKFIFQIRDVYEIIRSQHYGSSASQKELFYAAIRAMVAALKDPYSQFLTPEEVKEGDNSVADRNFEGVGVTISQRKGDILLFPLPGSPAEKAGIRSGDRLCAIGNLKVADIGSDHKSFVRTISLIRGKKGEKITLTVRRKGLDRPLEIEITCDLIIVRSVTWKMIEGKIGFVTINRFNREAAKSFGEAVDDITRSGAKAIIVDLRDNPGGLVHVAVGIAGYWVGDEVVVVEKRKGGRESTWKSGSKAVLRDMKTIILVNENTASAAELLAGALQDYGKATLIGSKTFGKGTMQEGHDLFDGSRLYLTVAEWLTPKRREINGRGLVPNMAAEDEGIVEKAMKLTSEK